LGLVLRLSWFKASKSCPGFNETIAQNSTNINSGLDVYLIQFSSQPIKAF
jgi:hypothetical protein